MSAHSFMAPPGSWRPMKLAWLVSLVLLGMALAGCTGGDVGTDDGDDQDHQDGHDDGQDDGDHDDSDGNMTDDDGDGDDGADNGSADNTPPIAQWTVNGTEGGAPLTTVFEMDATDEDGDDLTWTLELGDTNQTNGTTLPANHSHEYTQPGNYSVVFTVSDGTDTDSISTTIVVTDEPPSEVPGPVEFSGTVLTFSPLALAELENCGDENSLLNPEEGRYQYHDAEGQQGWDWTQTEGDVHRIEYYSPTNAFLDAASTDEGGTFPDNLGEVLVCSTDPTEPETSYTIRATHPDWTG